MFEGGGEGNYRSGVLYYTYIFSRFPQKVLEKKKHYIEMVDVNKIKIVKNKYFCE